MDDPLTNLRSIEQALSDLIEKQRSLSPKARHRCRLSRMISQLKNEISYRCIDAALRPQPNQL
jgi:hypothetical protein